MADLIKPRPVITTRNLHEHTAQEVFDFVCTKVIEQGKPSMKGASCAYRGAGGSKCAFGHLILDEDYDAQMEKAGQLDLFTPDTFEWLGWQNEAHRDLLTRLQWAHDMSAYDDGFLTAFKAKARAIARVEFHLDPHILDAAMPVGV
jgi:hypothetical protein